MHIKAQIQKGNKTQQMIWWVFASEGEGNKCEEILEMQKTKPNTNEQTNKPKPRKLLEQWGRLWSFSLCLFSLQLMRSAVLSKQGLPHNALL